MNAEVYAEAPKKDIYDFIGNFTDRSTTVSIYSVLVDEWQRYSLVCDRMLNL